MRKTKSIDINELQIECDRDLIPHVRVQNELAVKSLLM